MSSILPGYSPFERSDSERSLDRDQARAFHGHVVDQNSDFALHDKHRLQTPDIDAHDSKRHETGHETEKKKPGRKPIVNEPTTKRKAQNRAAQRAFRERKENHVKTLEARVEELERQNNDKSAENQYLKAQLARILGDSGFPQAKSFTFEVPPPVAARSHSSGSSSSSDLSSMDKVPARSQCPSLCSSSNESPTSGSEKEFNAALMPLFSTKDDSPESQNSFPTSSLPLTLGNGPQSFSSSASGIEPGTRSDELASTGQAFLDPDTLTFTDHMLSQSGPFDFNALDYRETANDFDTFEPDLPLFGGAEAGDPQCFVAPVPDLVRFENMANGLSPIKQEEDQTLLDAGGLTSSESDSLCSYVRCPEVWRKVVSHPKFASFDLDDFCHEFAVKNKCTMGLPGMEHSPEEWRYFDQKLDEFAERSEQKQ